MANYHNDSWFMSQLERHQKFGQTYLQDNEIIAVLYYGSGNYGCDSMESDCDSWIIYYDKAYNPATYQIQQIEFEDETVWFVDIRAFIYGLLNGNWTYLTALFTKYTISNPKCEQEWNALVEIKDSIAYINPINTAHSLIDSAEYKINNLYDMHIDNPLKQFYHLKILSLMFTYYRRWKPLSEFFNDENISQALQTVKHNSTLPRAELIMQGENLFELMRFQDIPEYTTNVSAIISRTLALIPKFESIFKKSQF